MSNRKSSHWLADSCLLATTVMWGVNLLVVKWILREIDPLSFNAVRMTLSTVALGLSVAVESRLASRERQPLDWKRFFAFALLSGLAYPLMFMLGVEETTAGNTALLLSSMPMWTAIISFLFLSERLSRLAWLGLVVTSLGTAVIALEKGSVDISIDHLKGNLLMLAAAITWATATVVSGPLLRQSSPLKVAFWANLTTTPIHLLITMNKIPTTLSALLEWPQIAGLFYSGILSTGLAYVTWHYGVRQLGASHAAAYQNVVTLVGVLGGWIFLSEHIALTQMLGGFAIVYGLLLARRGRPNKSSSFSSDSQEAIEVRPSKLSRE